MIRAECHSDDFRFTAKFDATPWFAQAIEDAVVNLSRQEWGGDYAADAIAHYLQDVPGYEHVAAMFDYLDARPRTPSGDLVGFEVNVHRDDAVRWLMANRRGVFDVIAVIEEIDAAEAERIAGATTAPHWDTDGSWPAAGYDRAAPETLAAPEAVLEFLAAEDTVWDGEDELTLGRALGRLQQMDQSVLDDLSGYFRENRPSIEAVNDGLVAAIAKYGMDTRVRGCVPPPRVAETGSGMGR